MCRTFPHVRAVGIDPYDAPLALARENVAPANLSDRIELRRIVVQDLRDEAAFDLAWLPIFFLGDREGVERAIERIRVAASRRLAADADLEPFRRRGRA
jgi:hypothetical protein